MKPRSLLLACCMVATACSEGPADPVVTPDSGYADSDGSAHHERDAAPGPDARVPVDASGAHEDATVEDGGEDGAAPAPEPFCGDGNRGVATEECDDGVDVEGDVCDDGCRVRVGRVTGQGPRRWGAGPHVMAANDTRVGAVFVSGEVDPEVELALFDARGVPYSDLLHMSTGLAPFAGSAHPAVAALPDGRLVVGWSDASGISPDILLRTVEAGGAMGPAFLAHVSTTGPQEDIELLWDGHELVVAWSELGDIEVRTFGANLVPAGPEDYLADHVDLEFKVCLAPFAGSYAAAYRRADGPLETVYVRAGDTLWSLLPSFVGGPNADRPALAALDDESLLVLVSVGDGGEGNSHHPPTALRAAVLNTRFPGETEALEPSLDLGWTVAGDAQRAPALVAAGHDVFVAWEENSEQEGWSRVRLSQLRWDRATGTLQVIRSLLLEEGSFAPKLAVANDGTHLLLAYETARELEESSLSWSLRPLPWLDLTQRGGP